MLAGCARVQVWQKPESGFGRSSTVTVIEEGGTLSGAVMQLEALLAQNGYRVISSASAMSSQQELNFHRDVVDTDGGETESSALKRVTTVSADYIARIGFQGGGFRASVFEVNTGEIVATASYQPSSMFDGKRLAEILAVFVDTLSGNVVEAVPWRRRRRGL